MDSASKRVTADFPPAAKAKGLSGTVYVNILVNKEGLVEKTCPVFEKGQPTPDESLVIVAEAAALRWTFPPNFGIEPADGIRVDYVEDRIIFRFLTPDVSK